MTTAKRRTTKQRDVPRPVEATRRDEAMKIGEVTKRSEVTKRDEAMRRGEVTKRNATTKRGEATRRESSAARGGGKRGGARQSEDGEAGRLLSWDEVQRTHRIRNGVYQRGGRLVSLLTDFGRINPCYPDRRDDADPDTIIYTGAGRRGDQHLTPANRALLAAVESGHGVPLFNKLAPGRWQHAGRWRVTAARHEFDAGEQRMLWRFTLRRVRRGG